MIDLKMQSTGASYIDPCQRKPNPSWILAAFLACFLLPAFASAQVIGKGKGAASVVQATCPNLQNPDLDYNCSLGPTYLIPGLTDLNGWTNPSQYRNILVGDLDGDQVDELVVRGVAGIEVYRFDRSRGQWTQVQSSTSPNSRTTILSDAVVGTDAAHRKYWDTIRLGDIDGDGKNELVVRLSTGVVVFRFTPFPINKDGTWDSGIWEQVTVSGPMADTDCFSNGKCWGDDPNYYSTLQLAPIGRLGAKPTMQLVGRGADGVELYRWNGSGWTKLATLPDLSSAKGFDAPEYYTTMLFREDLLLVRGPSGMRAYAFNTSPGTWQLLADDGPFPDKEGWNKPEYYSTIQLFRGLASIFAGFAGRGKDGVAVWAFDRGSPDPWVRASPGGAAPLSDAEGFAQPQYYRTMQFADIDGDGFDALLARRAGGMVIYRQAGTGGAWSAPISADEPALADNPWASDPSYYTAIKTARLDPASSARSLLARGPHGIRTWRFDAGASTWTRHLPYGNFPAVDASAFAAMNTFLRIQSGTIRTVYTGPSDPTPNDLADFQNSISALCTGVITVRPPQFKSCTLPPNAPPGVVPAAWTAVSNQIIAELFLAQEVIDHFETIRDIQTTLFRDEINQNTSLVEDLKLVQQVNVSATVNYVGLFRSILSILAAIPVPGLKEEFAVLSGAIGIVDAATVHGSAPSRLDRTIPQIQAEMTTLQQEMEDAVGRHRHYVLGDYGLLSTVGRLVSSQIWTLDKQAALSAGRQGFAVWLYEQFLPVLWDRWTVLNCQHRTGCDPPLDPVAPSGLQELAMLEFIPTTSPNAGSKSWDGLVPRQTGCSLSVDDVPVCSWATLEDEQYRDVLLTLREPVLPDCTFDPAGTSWEYGCRLGISAAEISSWPFRHFQCDFADGQDCLSVNPRMRPPPFQPIPPITRPAPIRRPP